MRTLAAIALFVFGVVAGASLPITKPADGLVDKPLLNAPVRRGCKSELLQEKNGPRFLEIGRAHV